MVEFCCSLVTTILLKEFCIAGHILISSSKELAVWKRALKVRMEKKWIDCEIRSGSQYVNSREKKPRFAYRNLPNNTNVTEKSDFHLQIDRDTKDC